ncbi:SLOG family protein [Aerosakkonema sp. BLCC-F183]|uniref:SLOG family protein n=1 Tax=Aerosakkonema sp. BLCC-F183 TaxID=3342834 RepID=UPI0035BBDAE6
MKAFFTGHRYIDEFGFANHINQLISYARQLGTTEFYCGMALGTDQIAAKLLIKHQLKWTAVIPCADQDEKWSKQQRSHYHKLLDAASKQIVLYSKYSAGCMQARNLWMVKRSDLCLAVWDGRDNGGTAMTVNAAIDRNLPIIQFNPSNSKFSKIDPQYQQLSLF